MEITDTELIALVNGYFWPFVRIAGVVMVAPVFNARIIPLRVRLILALALTAIVAPLVPAVPALHPLSAAGLLITAQELLIGLSIGFVLQMVFDAMVIAGQTAAMSMGLGFAVMLDPQRGVSVPVLSQYLLILATLTFLALNGHLMLIELLAESFHTLPVGGEGIGRDGIWQIASRGTRMFSGALQVALPAVVALLVVNLAFGVMSRAAPTLNLFAVGFPVTMTLGFVILLWSLPNVQQVLAELLRESFLFLRGMTRQ